jgi:hypothetical protein
MGLPLSKWVRCTSLVAASWTTIHPEDAGPLAQPTTVFGPDSDVVKAREGRQVEQEEKHAFHQGPKARICLHDKAGSMTASVPIRA